jgi:TRAP-type C4-dicarboxylate transport system substrate-binding protein
MTHRNAKRKIASTLVFAVAALAMYGQAHAATKFNANVFFVQEHPLAKFGYVEWAKIVEEMSGGELKPKVFTGTVLLPPRAGLSGIRDGITQVGYAAGSYTPAELPVSAAIQELGFNYSDPLAIAAAITDFAHNDAEMQAQWKKVGVVYGGGYATPPYRFFCREPVRNLKEIKGKKLRTSGSAVSRWVETVGAIPVNVPSSEMYTGLDKGTLDCATNAANDLKSRSLWDVSKHTTLVPLGMYWSGFEWGYNPDFWKSLSPEHRRILLDSQARAMAKLYIGYKAASEEALTQAPDHGVTVYEPEADLLGSITDFTKENMVNVYKTAKDSYGIAEPEKLISRFQQTVDKWQKLFEGVDRGDEVAIAKVLKEQIYDKIDVKTYGMN